MTMQKVCTLNDIIPEAGVCALISTETGGKQVAIFRTKEDELFAIDNFDPFSNANVLSRGLIGGTVVTNEDGTDQDILYVASPIYKQRFDLATGQCLDDESVKLGSYEVSLDGDAVMVGAAVEDKVAATETAEASETTEA